jgi:hypothetical protein
MNKSTREIVDWLTAEIESGNAYILDIEKKRDALGEASIRMHVGARARVNALSECKQLIINADSSSNETLDDSNSGPRHADGNNCLRKNAEERLTDAKAESSTTLPKGGWQCNCDSLGIRVTHMTGSYCGKCNTYAPGVSP